MHIFGLQKLTLLDYPGKIACTVFLGGCNMRCPFCHNGALARGEGEDIMSSEELLAFLDSRRGRLQGVCVSGGEPTLHRDLPLLLRDIKSRGFSVKLDTNGTNPEMLLGLINDGLVDYVAMDIKNSPAKYAETAGVECRMQNAECRVQNAELARLDLASSTTMFQELEQDADAECRMQNAELARLDLASSTTMFQELEQNAECRMQNAECRAHNSNPLLDRVKQSAALLMQGRVDFEFRTTLVSELHTTEDLESIGRWLSGDEKFFLQTYRDEGDLLVGGFTPFTREKTESLLSVLKRYVPNAEIRG